MEMLMPTVRRAELESDDIIAERGVVPMRKRPPDRMAAFGTPTSQCIGKVSFMTRAEAEKAAQRRPGRVSYRCRYCRNWHNGNHLDK